VNRKDYIGVIIINSSYSWMAEQGRGEIFCAVPDLSKMRNSFLLPFGLEIDEGSITDAIYGLVDDGIASKIETPHASPRFTLKIEGINGFRNGVDLSTDTDLEKVYSYYRKLGSNWLAESLKNCPSDGDFTNPKPST
jgi:hypothetical protein